MAKSKTEIVEEHVNKIMLELQNASVVANRPREFRASGLPFCPILSFLRGDNVEDYHRTHYTSSGTAIHETIQTWMSISPASKKYMFGNWKCTGCAKIVKHQRIPSKLCDCDHVLSDSDRSGSGLKFWPKFWTYSEIQVRRKNLGGHIDLMTLPLPNFVIMWDFKSTSMGDKRRWGQDMNKPSIPSYTAQIRTYSAIADIDYDLPVKAWCLVALDRDRPVRTVSDFSVVSADWSRKRSKKWLKYIDAADDNHVRLKKLEKSVLNEDSKAAKKHLKSVIKYRPCKSREDYDKFMVYGFMTGECKMCKACFKSDKATAKAVQKRLAEMD